MLEMPPTYRLATQPCYLKLNNTRYVQARCAHALPLPSIIQLILQYYELKIYFTL